MTRPFRLRRAGSLLEVPERMPVGATIAHATNVSVVRQSNPVLNEVTLEVAAGELVALVGPNGAGKSTLLAVLAGDLRPDSGAVNIFGQAVAQWDPVALAQRRAVLPQHCDVSFPFRVDQVVAMGRSPWARTTTSAHDDAAVDAALEALEVTSLRARPMSALSGGEAARVAIARVFAQQTQLLLLDEPTAALDVRHVAHTMAHVRTHVRGGGAAVVVLHDLDLAAAFANRIVVLAKGSVRRDGPPREALRGDILSEVYRHPIRVIDDEVTGASIVRPIHPT